MSMLLAGREVICEPRGRDMYDRTLGLCRAGGKDVQAEMVSAGMAWAFVRYSRDYVQQEAQAKSLRLGVHLHDCQPAWEWRAAQKRAKT